MSAFRPETNTRARMALAALLALLLLGIGFPLLYARTVYFTGQSFPAAQPVPFDHRHHVADDGIDCRYCHQTVDAGATAGFPSAEQCMGCHGQIWNKSPPLELVRQSFFEGRPIAWRRVHRLPDFVFFNHANHVMKGIGCVSCHGRVDQMAAVEQVQPLNMGWCLECHRAPERNLRPPDRITDMTWRPPPGREGDALARSLATLYEVKTRVSCTTCHR
jgi:hypothetical protein